MRHIKQLLTAAALLLSLAASAQNDVTTFMGIPVDGPRDEMTRKLEARGFTKHVVGDIEILTGEFNGLDSKIYLATTRGKVRRVAVIGYPADARLIRDQYNWLVEQFASNSKYYTPEDYTLPENEDIGYQMLVNGKTYQAIFYQLPSEQAITLEVVKILELEYSQVEYDKLSEKQKEDLKTEVKLKAIGNIYDKKPVAVMLEEDKGKFYTMIVYDNPYNYANGEDL